MFELTVNNTMWFSLFMQILTGLIALFGIFIDLPPKDVVLAEILRLELIVQFVEMVFYVWIAYAMLDSTLMTSRRYIDWIITTPTMLLATIIFMKYQEKKEKKKLDTVTFMGFVKENKDKIMYIFLYNFLMLAFGYLGEVEFIPKYIGIPIGFYFFYKSFYIVYTFAKESVLGLRLFVFLVSVW